MGLFQLDSPLSVFSRRVRYEPRTTKQNTRSNRDNTTRRDAVTRVFIGKKMIGGSISRRPCSGASLAYVLMICLLVFTEVKFHTIDLAEGNVPFRT